jgi:hypothetical protein
MNKLPYGEDINYWQTSKTSSDKWMESTVKLIKSFGGKVTGEAYGSEPNTGRSAFMLSFELQGESFKIIWPILPSKAHNERAARIQAATLLHHDIKNSLLKVAIFGARNALFQYWMLPDGRTVAEVSRTDLMDAIPKLFSAPSQSPRLTSGDDVIDSDYKIVK